MKSIITTKYLNKSLFLVSFLFFSFSSTSQTDEDINLFSNLFETHKHKTGYVQYFKNSSNELELITTGIFVFYKAFFSSQDGNHCVFYPSCSIYAVEAIKKQGFILGTMNGVDRLSRCNRLSPENYTFYKNTNLFYDPVE